MKVALLTDGIYPHVMGGMQRHSFYLAKYMAEFGVDVLLIHPTTGKSEKEFLSEFTDQERHHIEVIEVPFIDQGKVPGHYVRASYRYSKAVFNALQPRLTEIDFIYAKGFTAWHTLKTRKKGDTTIPPIGVKFHGYEMFQRQASFRGRIESRLLKRPTIFNNQNADVIFSYGGKVTEIIKSIGIPKDKIIEIPSGIENSWIEESIEPTEQPIQFAFIGRYERRKGIQEIHNAIRSTNDQAGFKFDLIGPIPEEHRVDDPRVTYHGQITDKKRIKSILRSSDILMCPSYSEGMPNVILEGMASGLAIFATNVGATSMLVSSNNGWIIDDLDRIEVSIRELLEKADSLSEDNIDRMKMESLHKARQFTWEEVSRNTIKEIQKVVDQS